MQLQRAENAMRRLGTTREKKKQDLFMGMFLPKSNVAQIYIANLNVQIYMYTRRFFISI